MTKIQCTIKCYDGISNSFLILIENAIWEFNAAKFLDSFVNISDLNGNFNVLDLNREVMVDSFL